MPKISFILPIYGVEKYLEKCVDSILSQTFTDFEVILVDDGSPDKCGEICDKYAANDPRVHVIHKKNAGVSAARNTGIDNACGEWAYFVDSDDWLEPDAAETLYSAAVRTGADCVMSDVLVHYPKAPKRGYLFSEEFYTEDRTVIQSVQKFILCHKYSPYYTPKTIIGFAAPWAKFTRMSIIKENQVYFDPYARGRFDDGIWSLYLLDYVNKFYYLPKQTYNYRIVASSLTHAFKPTTLEVLDCGYELTEKWIRETNKDESFMKAHYGRVCMFFAMQLFQYFFNPSNPKSHKEVIKELKDTMHREPYCTAIKKVDMDKLEKKQKLVIACAKLKFIPALRLYALLKIRQGEKL